MFTAKEKDYNKKIKFNFIIICYQGLKVPQGRQPCIQKVINGNIDI
jgi:hypothetical protein